MPSSSAVRAKGGSSGANGDSGVVEDEAGMVVDQLTREPEGGSSVVVALVGILVVAANVSLLEASRSTERSRARTYAARAAAYVPTVRPIRRTGRALVSAEDSRSTSRQPSR